MIANARLSLTSQPIMSADAIGVTTLHYTDGMTVDITADVSSLAIGAYDVSLSADGTSLVFGAFGSSCNTANYLGAINVSIAGQLTCHFSLDCDRKFEVYNAFNQRQLLLRVITQERGITYTPANQYPNWLPFNNNPLNRGAIITGRHEAVDVVYYQGGFLDSLSGPYALLNAVGWNGAQVGMTGGGTHDDMNTATGYRMLALYSDPAVIGVNVATMLVGAGVYNNDGLSVIYSAPVAPPLDSDVVMLIKWQG